MLNQVKLMELCDFNVRTGKFTSRVARGTGAKVGEDLGFPRKDGYMVIGIEGKNYQAHRLVWLFVHGELPKGQIDHINGNRSDNRIENLRVVSNRENQQNRKCHREGALVGTSFHKPAGKWTSQITIDGKKIHLGLFSSAQFAHERYQAELKSMEGIDMDWIIPIIHFRSSIDSIIKSLTA